MKNIFTTAANEHKKIIDQLRDQLNEKITEHQNSQEKLKQSETSIVKLTKQNTELAQNLA